MAKQKDILPGIRETETWKTWGKRYQLELEGVGKKPFRVAEGKLSPIPPDTIDSLLCDLETGEDTLPFENIAKELAEKHTESQLEDCSPMSDAAHMLFWLNPESLQ